MTQALRKGWCPSLLNPMESGDGFLARVKPAAATIDVAAARAIAEAAETYGNGLIDVTNRSNLQFRGFTPESIAVFADVVLAHNLAEGDVAREQLRNVAASPLGADDPAAAFDAHAAALALEAMLLAEPSFQRLPPKFGLSVDGGGHLPLGDVGADIRFENDGSNVRVGLGGSRLSGCCDASAVAETARELIAAFLALGADLDVPPRRMRHLVDTVGAEAVFLRAGMPDLTDTAANNHVSADVGFAAYRGSERGFAVFGLPFGQCDANAFAKLADLSGSHGDGTIRLTPWRCLAITGVSVSDADLLLRRGSDAGFITENDDPRRVIIACPGAPACSSAQATTRIDATHLAETGVLGNGPVHVSGCAKGCAMPRPAAVTLVGRDGRYDVILDGRTDGAPVREGFDVDDLISFFQDSQRSASA